MCPRFGHWQTKICCHRVWGNWYNAVFQNIWNRIRIWNHTWKFELSVQDQVLLWGNRVVVPPQGRVHVIEGLHEAHPGITRMKALARGLVWWPGIDAALEDKVKTRSVCQENRAAPAEARLHRWDWPEKPWSRLHLDYAGPLQRKMFLVLIDAHSKWMDVFLVHSATTSAILECLRQTFAICGIAETIVTDNSTCFTSEELWHLIIQLPMVWLRKQFRSSNKVLRNWREEQSKVLIPLPEYPTKYNMVVSSRDVTGATSTFTSWLDAPRHWPACPSMTTEASGVSQRAC